jgi:putative ABC transport system permease protein
VREVAPDIPMTLPGSTGSWSAVGTVDVNGGLGSRRFDAWLLASFAASALLLAAVGIYGLLAYSVAQRRREMGLRQALGAERRDIVRVVVGGGMRLAGVGIGIGVLAAFPVTRLLAALLYGVGASDPPTFVGVVALLALVSFLASYVPARRAARVDPMVALRHE